MFNLVTLANMTAEELAKQVINAHQTTPLEHLLATRLRETLDKFEQDEALVVVNNDRVNEMVDNARNIVKSFDELSAEVTTNSLVYKTEQV